MAFSADQFLPIDVFERLTDIRVQDPQRAQRVALRRRQRKALSEDGRLNILAADHPARRVTRVGARPLAMANRRAYLARIARVMTSHAIDGLMATMDVLEELLLLHDLVQAADGAPFLDHKLLIPSLNRGGLAGVAWEMDDPLTGATPQSCGAWRMDGAKALLRFCDEEPASLKTMVACAGWINALNALGLPMFLEPLPVTRVEDDFRVTKTAEALAKVVGVASALGHSSRYLWLKLPYCDDYQTVARATSLPILLLGGESVGDAAPLLTQVAAGMAAAGNVRGALVGRNVLYPGDEDPLVVAGAVHHIVHRQESIEQAWENAQAQRGQQMDALTRWVS